MPSFEYTASDRTGAISKGAIQAKDKGAASRELGSQGLFVLEIKPAPESAEAVTAAALPPKAPHALPNRAPREAPTLTTVVSHSQPAPPKKAENKEPKSPRFRFFRGAGWSALQRALYLRQLCVMFTAGIPIHKATELLTENEEYRDEVRARLEEVPRDLQRGRLLSKSLQKSELFGRLVVSSVKVGEQTGRLDQVLKSLADGEEQSVKLKRTLVAKLTYPVIVLLIMSIGLVILGHVMSRVMASLPGFKPEDVPLFGYINAAFQHGAFLPSCFAFTVLGLGLCWKIWHTPPWRLGAERIFFGLPILGNLLTRVETNTVTGQLSLLIEAGIPLDRGIELCSDLVWTETFRKALLLSRLEIRAGSEVGESFQAIGLFPDDVLALIMAGEMSGRLEDALSRAASYCADQVERTIETALALLEPLLIAFLGVAIGAVLLCTFVPIFNTLQTL